MLELPPLSLYIHVPWCVKKCPYCDFNSHEAGTSPRVDDYLRALVDDFRSDANLIQSRVIQSVFVGGGTPSLMTAEFYEELFGELRTLAEFSDNLELTLEANPGTTDSARFTGYRNAGVNRLSIGIQSFDNKALKHLGRIHDSDQGRRAISTCRDAGFEDFNLDLMYGLPDQTVTDALSDLETALQYNPGHLSWYQLTIEPNTAYYSAPPQLPDEETIMTIQTEGLVLLQAAGLSRYEVSAYARPTKQSRHNLNYWMFGDYLGIGAGAHGKITLPKSNQIVRTRKVKQPNNYLEPKRAYLAEQTCIAADDLGVEFMMNVLRLTNGFDIALFASRTGMPFSDIRKKIDYLKSEGLLNQIDNRLLPSDKGQLFVNSLLEVFL